MMPPPAYSESVPGPGMASAPPYAGGGGEVMVVCGGWDGDRALETVEMLDPRTGQWSFLPNMMGQCHSCLVLVLSLTLFPYSPETRPWSRGAGRVPVRGGRLEH